MTTQFKVGDKVKRILDSNEGVNPGDIGTITSINGEKVWLDIGAQGPTCWHNSEKFELITKNNITNTMTNIIKKFTSMFISEPQKSYQKAGITDENNVLTDEGLKIYATYLLNNDTTFKTEIVDLLLAEEK